MFWFDEDNEEAWRCYARINSHRWVWDAEAGAWWLQQVLAEYAGEEREDVMSRIDIIYDVLHPPKEAKRGA